MSQCIACGNGFQCGMVDTGADQPCWCTQLPPLPAGRLQSADDGRALGCYCPACLRDRVATPDEIPDPGR